MTKASVKITTPLNAECCREFLEEEETSDDDL